MIQRKKGMAIKIKILSTKNNQDIVSMVTGEEEERKWIRIVSKRDINMAKMSSLFI